MLSWTHYRILLQVFSKEARDVLNIIQADERNRVVERIIQILIYY